GAVVAHPAVAEALRVDGVLEVVDLAQLLGGDLLPEGDAGGEAGGGGLVRDRQRELTRDLPHLGLRHADGGQRAQHLVAPRGAGARAGALRRSPSRGRVPPPHARARVPAAPRGGRVRPPAGGAPGVAGGGVLAARVFAPRAPRGARDPSNPRPWRVRFLSWCTP